MKSRVRGHRDGGRLFQTSGSQNANARRPSSLHVPYTSSDGCTSRLPAQRSSLWVWRAEGDEVGDVRRTPLFSSMYWVIGHGSLLYRIGRGLIVHWVSWASTNLPLSALINTARNCQELRHNGRRMHAVTSMPISMSVIYLGINAVWRFCII